MTLRLLRYPAAIAGHLALTAMNRLHRLLDTMIHTAAAQTMPTDLGLPPAWLDEIPPPGDLMGDAIHQFDRAPAAWMGTEHQPLHDVPDAPAPIVLDPADPNTRVIRTALDEAQYLTAHNPEEGAEPDHRPRHAADQHQHNKPVPDEN